MKNWDVFEWALFIGISGLILVLVVSALRGC